MSGANLIIPDDFGRGDITPRPDAFMGQRLTGETMGTTWSASWCAAPGLSEERVKAALEANFAAIISSMSPWEPASLISQFNRLPRGGSLAIDTAFAEVMAMALEVADASGGAFDPCLGGAVMRRGFGPAGIGAGQEGRAHGPAVWSQLLPEPVRLYQPGGVTLDLNAVAKGYAVDQMGRVLEGLGLTQFLVEIGGEFTARGVKPDRSPWWVDLENPSPQEAPWRLALVGHGVATSGDYRQQVVQNCLKVSHIVPAMTRQCSQLDLACVTVVHDNCALADAWATALFAMGDTASLTLANRLNLPILLQYRDAPARASTLMSGWLI
ncbi:ApbE family protein [Hyphomonas neptunium ATCC 15444]|uniref:FAD:protein FMN transferase n=3 Tax=Hyphomonadaceae TaxID=69657 RepID=Q0C1N3_HYPNA|nr:ApbE family protein [Hyphomonas neptunium ATCC 15444]KCZ92556.1 ApbE family protein [Hyphomonas hirschiana VP5]